MYKNNPDVKSQGPTKTETQVKRSFEQLSIFLQVSELQLIEWSDWPVVREVLSYEENRNHVRVFSREDVYVFTVLKFLHEQRFSRLVIEMVVKKVFQDAEMFCAYLAVSQKGDVWSIDHGYCDDTTFNQVEPQENPVCVVPAVMYDIDIKGMMGWANWKMAVPFVPYVVKRG